jgi:hypothetical protein
MGLAATTDLRGQEIVPEVLAIVRKARDRPLKEKYRALRCGGGTRKPELSGGRAATIRTGRHDVWCALTASRNATGGVARRP